MSQENAKAQVGLIGLAVMGQNLALNMADKGFTVAVHNRTAERIADFIAGPAAGTAIVGADTIDELVGRLETPRRIILMVKAGRAVDAVLDALIPLLDEGDVVIDGGNSHYLDSARRVERLEEAGLLFVGAGISGGEEGARHGPSIMPGGSAAAWPLVRDILQSIAAKVDDGTPCCDWIGPGGSGHFVKMVHNGIEYGDIQLLGEAYDIMRRGLGMDYDAMADVFAGWNRGRLDSYLVEITADVLRHREDGEPLLEVILDAAGQKGTGRWTVEAALAFGMPVTLVAEAVFARATSSLTGARKAAAPCWASRPRRSRAIGLPSSTPSSRRCTPPRSSRTPRDSCCCVPPTRSTGGTRPGRHRPDVARGVHHPRRLPRTHPGRVRRRSRPRDAHARPVLRSSARRGTGGWRSTVAEAVRAGIPTPAYSSALAFFDAYRSERLPGQPHPGAARLLRRPHLRAVDRPRGEFFHTNWTGRGGEVAAGSYNA
jgi:6-phosphogluconate dehydrogenase